MRKAYSDNQLNVKVIMPLSFDFNEVPGITKAVQVFPNNPKLSGWYTITVEPSQLERVKTDLEKLSGIVSVEKVALRYTS